ncbi:NAD(P)-dependent dehydrogenase (short-subunit alcohol dehydrogenase family) [Novosphingobium sp. PhB57]|uniref:SDR family NAD(P)-dependent oxidoreductase n=1 Tax=Novosphingobium sp. PhB57 TaxID=2485107 RepID=UPI001053A1D3|nr:SDR family NAD(P)-dependent oxidoreductase [Novosphingobium sp. PhB57]TCU57879.1 NAD(P)-dependent dehydrogenase (short-subunit alcohol dehydrogenase family) [Novosphingobium sp. PhB57]
MTRETNKDRVVVVTGGASGMGLGICRLFARNGHPVAMLDRQEEALEREAGALRAEGANVLPLRADVGNRNDMAAAYDAVRRSLGPISIVIANAGISASADFLTMSVETWQRMIDVNLNGVFHTVQLAAPDMVARKWGRIVTISSQAAQSGAQDRAHYAASKGGVIGLTRSLARELAVHGITVNTIPPSLVDTPLARAGVNSGEVPPLEVIAQAIPIARPGTPEDIANACEFLCSDKASYITGQEINVNGGTWM